MKTRIDSLPHDLLVKIVAKLASVSSTPLRDVKNLRTTCKKLRAASNARKVGKCMDVSKEHSKYWWDKEGYFEFLRYCEESGNLQASFILGLEHIYNQGQMETGFHYLRKAMAGGHRAAAYALGVHNFCLPTNRSLGMEILSRVAGGDSLSTSSTVIRRTALNISNIKTCRNETLEVLRNLTWPKMSSEPKVQCLNQYCGEVVRTDNMWLPNDELCKRYCSQECMWREEVYLLNSLI